MNILFDFLTVCMKTGAAEYQRRVFFEMMDYISSAHLDVTVFALFDSSRGIAYDDLNEEFIRHRYAVKFLDCKEHNVDRLVAEYQIDRLFIACAQSFINEKEIANLTCDVICVAHDVQYEENYKDKIFLYCDLIEPGADNPAKFPKLGFIRNFFPFKKILDHFDRFSLVYVKERGNERYKPCLDMFKPVIDLYHNNPQVKMVAVSEYSKRSLMYYYDIKEEDILVLYSPERIDIFSKDFHNSQLKVLVESKKKYYLMVSANRNAKNPHKVINAFAKFSKLHPDAFLVTLGYGEKIFENHISLPFLCDTDLAHAYANCYALLFPSFFEGFGYPPVEAMHYGKPVLCSNTTSMPEILGDAPIYFSPFYESGIYGALCMLNDENYSRFEDRSQIQYSKVKERQEKDLCILIDMIINGNSYQK